MKKSNYDFYIDKERGITYEKFEGIITKDDLILINREKLNHPDFKIGLHILVDIAKAEIGLTNEEISEYSQFLMEKKDYYIGTKCAIITNSPDQVVKSYFFKEYSKALGNVEIFSTYERATEWLHG